MKKLFFISMLFSGAMHVNGMNIDNNPFGGVYATNQQQDEQIEISVEKTLKDLGFTKEEELSEALDDDIYFRICDNAVYARYDGRPNCYTVRSTEIPFTKEKEELLSENSKYRQFQSSSLNGRYNWNVLEAPECLMELHNKIQQWFTENHNDEGKYTLDKNKIDELAIMIQGTVKNSSFIYPNCKYEISSMLYMSECECCIIKYYGIDLLLDNYEKLHIRINYEDPSLNSDLGSISFQVYPKNH